MSVSLKDGTIIKFIDVPEWKYNQIISSPNPSKELDDYAKVKPNI